MKRNASPAPSPSSPNEEHKPKRSRWVWLFAVAGVAVLAVSAIVWSANGGLPGASNPRAAAVSPATKAGATAGTPAASAATAAPTPKPTIHAVPAKAPITDTAAKSSLGAFISAKQSVNAKTVDIAKDLSKVAAGAIVDEISNEQLELTSNDWSMRGSAKISAVKVIKTDSPTAPTTATVQACVDSSGMTLLDAKGKPVASSARSATNRALNIFTLKHSADGWLVTARTFPDNPTC